MFIKLPQTENHSIQLYSSWMTNESAKVISSYLNLNTSIFKEVITLALFNTDLNQSTYRGRSELYYLYLCDVCLFIFTEVNNWECNNTGATINC